MDDVVGVLHGCDFPNEANTRPRVTHCPLHNAGLASKEVDDNPLLGLKGFARDDAGEIYVLSIPRLGRPVQATRF
jgi:hypothetical protein